MRKKFAIGLVAFLATTGLASAGPIIDVFTALAPNVFGSPSFATWQTNAISSMQNGGVATGTPGTPTYFEVDSLVTSAQAIVTGFPSWMGQVDPGAVFGGAFASELGNRMTFPLHIDGNGEEFSISELGLNMDSNDVGNGLDFSFAVGGYNYGAGYFGLNYGLDNIKGNGDDIWVTGGANTQLVDELFGRGSGNSFAAYCPGCNLAAQQAALDAAAAYPGVPFDFTGTYRLERSGNIIAEGSGTFHVESVPEPATLSLLGFGIGLVGFRARRHWQRARA